MRSITKFSKEDAFIDIITKALNDTNEWLSSDQISALVKQKGFFAADTTIRKYVLIMLDKNLLKFKTVGWNGKARHYILTGREEDTPAQMLNCAKSEVSDYG